ncbi:Protein transport protein Sec31B [Armadillidium nasatum]|uniref:Protein transport protein Sec31B n=1 Tax=Armadillidium nasatum TaxID=96803 RepID=A0A5N5TC03_9CRUS|nr:Protein transport protein Sec31B [Armadillidium nasatum]
MLPSASVAPHSQVVPPQPPKGPLPAEHQVIQDVFNRLREKGIVATNNPAVKQRLEDLSMKLEILYDKLREGKIGANTIGGLHEIVSAVKAGDYHRALQLHAATIGSGAFSEMSQFMPPVKMLLTTCMQCQVFYN